VGGTESSISGIWYSGVIRDNAWTDIMASIAEHMALSSLFFFSPPLTPTYPLLPLGDSFCGSEVSRASIWCSTTWYMYSTRSP